MKKKHFDQRRDTELHPETSAQVDELISSEQEPIRELEMRLAELQRKNDELLRLHAAAEAEREYYAELYDFAPMGCVALTGAGNICRINLTAAEMLGGSGAGLLQKSFIKFISERDRPIFLSFLQKVFVSRVKEFCEFALADNSLVLQMQAICSADGHECRSMLVDITKNKKEEQSLLENQAKLGYLFERLPVGISILDGERKLLYENSALSRILDLSKRSLVNGDYLRRKYIRSDGSVMPAEEFASTRAFNEHKAVENVEIGIVKEDGETTWCNVNASPLPFNDWSMVVTTVDVSERKRMEEDLKRSQDLLETVTKGTQVIIATIDTDFRYTFFNSSYKDEIKRLTGKELQLGISMQDLFAHQPEQQKNAITEWTQVLAGQSTNRQLKFGESEVYRRVYQVLHTPLLDADGRIVGAGEVAFDVTRQVQAEEALRESEERYRLLYENSMDGIFLTSPDGRIMAANPTACRIYGRTEEEICRLGRSGVVDMTDPRIPAAVEERARTGSFRTEMRLVHKDGHVFPGEVSSTVFTDAQGQQRTSMFVRDITEKKRIEDALREQSQNLEKLVGERTLQLAETNQRLAHVLDEEKTIRMQLVQTEKHGAIGRMMASIAHELNNPIQTIQNCLYIIQQEVVPDSASQEFVEMASAEIERIAVLVSQLREIYRPQPGDDLKNVDLQKILKDVNSLILPHLQHENVFWLNTGSARSVMIWAVPDQIKQVFINLVLNAIEAMRPQGGNLCIDTFCPENSNVVRVSVQDNGPGIPAENLSRVFEPFYTTKETGMGLGLSICYDIVKKLGGDITVESITGQGTTFSVWLPLAVDQPNPELD